MKVSDLVKVFVGEVYLDIESDFWDDTLFSGQFNEIEETNPELLDRKVSSVDQTCSGTLIVFIEREV